MTNTIVLIQPPIRDFYLTRKRTIPYGLLSLAAQLKAAGFTVAVLDALATDKSRLIEPPESMRYLAPYYGREDFSPFALFHGFRHYGYSFQHIGRYVQQAAPFIVGISALFSPYADTALYTAEIVRRKLPTAAIVVGGHHATAMPAHIMACNAVDLVLRGEGEFSLPLLAGALQSGQKDLSHIPGIVFRKPDGTLHISPPAVVDKLDDPAPPAISLLKHAYYRRHQKNSWVITAGRGCPLNCSYCAVGQRSPLPYRRRRVASVIRELEAAVTEFKAGFIDFEDENISFDRRWFKQLLRAIADRFSAASLEIRAMNGLFPPSLDDEAVQLMQQAGFRSLNLALGTSSQEQLRRFNRPDVRSGFEKALNLAEKYDLQAVGYIIAAAPGQNPAASVDDLLYLAARRVLAGISIFYPAPGSADFDLCRAQGLLPPDPALFRSSALPIDHTTTRTDAATLLRLARILNYMKALLDRGIGIPPPLALPRRERMNPENRDLVGKRLLQAFLHDGGIRGITADGEIFAHTISPTLIRRFVAGLQRIRIRGCR